MAQYNRFCVLRRVLFCAMQVAVAEQATAAAMAASPAAAAMGGAFGALCGDHVSAQGLAAQACYGGGGAPVVQVINFNMPAYPQRPLPLHPPAWRRRRAAAPVSILRRSWTGRPWVPRGTRRTIWAASATNTAAHSSGHCRSRQARNAGCLGPGPGPGLGTAPDPGAPLWLAAMHPPLRPCTATRTLRRARRRGHSSGRDRDARQTGPRCRGRRARPPCRAATGQSQTGALQPRSSRSRRYCRCPFLPGRWPQCTPGTRTRRCANIAAALSASQYLWCPDAA
jgi:hypothetical protein